MFRTFLFWFAASIKASRLHNLISCFDLFTFFSCSSLHTVLVPAFTVKYLLKPHERGFFCNDESIKYPHQKSTIKLWMLVLFGVVMPIVTVSYQISPHTYFIYLFELPVSLRLLVWIVLRAGKSL